MGYLNEFPHVKTWDSDLRQILEMYETVKGLPKSWEEFSSQMSSDWAELKEFVTTFFAELDVQNEINAKIDVLVANGTMDTIMQRLFDGYSREVALLNARMDTFTTLGEGSTTGDAEIADARVDFKGNTHTNVGEHIRTVTSEIAEKINITKNIYDLKNGMTLGGAVEWNTGNIVADSWCYSDYIMVEGGKTYYGAFIDSAFHNIPNINYAFYDANKVYISGSATSNGKMSAPENAVYLRVSFAKYYLTFLLMLGLYDEIGNLTDVNDYEPFGNQTNGDLTLKKLYSVESLMIAQPYITRLRDKIYFKFRSIVYYHNNVRHYYTYNFDTLKGLFPNNWQGWNIEKVSETMLLSLTEALYFDIEKNELVIRENGGTDEENQLLLLAWNGSVDQFYGKLAESYFDKTMFDVVNAPQNFLSVNTMSSINSKENEILPLIDDEKFVFSWVSDNHYVSSLSGDEADTTSMAIAYTDTNLDYDAILNCGDSVMTRNYTNAQGSLKKVAKFINADKLVYCEGNHDRNIEEPILSKKEFYNIMYRRFRNNDDVVFGSKTDAYFYRDFPNRKVRVISLNLYVLPEGLHSKYSYDQYTGLNQAEAEWLANVALNVPNDWHVIVMSHNSPRPTTGQDSATFVNPSVMIGILESFVNGSSVTVSHNGGEADGTFNVSVTTNFTNKGNLVAVLTGHGHADDFVKTNGINYIQITSGYIDVVNESSGYKNREAFSYSAIVFDVGILDTTNRTLKLKRVGYGSDRSFTY